MLYNISFFIYEFLLIKSELYCGLNKNVILKKRITMNLYTHPASSHHE